MLIQLDECIELKRDAFDHTEEPIAVEFVTCSLTSQNLDDKMGWATRTKSIPIEQEVMKAFPHIRWCDFDRVIRAGQAPKFYLWGLGAGDFNLYETLRVKRSYAAGFTPSPFLNKYWH
ncbi:MAG: hypothetical protein HEQ35_10200 [Gloeotrichia echinulata IR180]